MKLAEVAAGGQQWNFENLPEEPSTPCDEAEELEEDNYKNGDNDNVEEMHCNGHDNNGDKNGDSAVAATDEDNNGQTTPNRPPLVGSTTEAKPDPVTEITPDLQVKIADLGNACWVVRQLKARRAES